MLKEKIVILDQEISLLKRRDDVNLLTDDEAKSLKAKKVEIEKARKDLIQKHTERNQVYRIRKRKILENISNENPEYAKKLKLRHKTGRPRIDEDQPDLLKIIIEIATHGGAADERRRTEGSRSVKTLDQLHSR